jgi:hypothetical protein
MKHSDYGSPLSAVPFLDRRRAPAILLELSHGEKQHTAQGR